MADMLFYFGFGSNLSKRKMLSRGANFESREGAVLKNYRLKFNAKGNDGYAYSNIEPQDGSVVYGALYTLSSTSMDNNDKQHIKNGGPLRRITVEVVRNNGEVVEALTYTANPEFIDESLKPSREYLETMLEGSDVLPDSHVQHLQEMLKGL